ncbi:hypothetical protein C8R45DRAFT_1101212 [Mycena sanguinolenta]|nr:hypothetical protein C8R45DRAFT_1101212 [Mycena sanguinolenta]
MGRVKTGALPGRTSHFQGEKEEWLSQFRERLQDADDVGEVYDDATLRFLERYGYDLPFGQNIDGNPEDHPPLTGPSMSGPAKKPRRLPAVVVYSKMRYAMRVKPDFDKLWEAVKATLQPSARVALSQDFVRTCWEKESLEFRAEVESAAQEMHRVAMETWKAKRQIPQRSAEQYHHALGNFNEVGIPMVDALSEHLGAHVAILVVGPVGEAGGEVLLRSVFSDTSNGATKRTWPEFDHKGFSAMEESITRYGRAFFTKAECAARTWPPLQAEDGEPAGQPAPVATAATAVTSPTAVPASHAAAPASHAAAPAALIPAAPAVPVTAAPTAPALVPAVTAASQATPAIVPPVTGDVNALEGLIRMHSPLAQDDGIDRMEWGDHLTGAHAYLRQKKWGLKWENLLTKLVYFE